MWENNSDLTTLLSRKHVFRPEMHAAARERPNNSRRAPPFNWLSDLPIPPIPNNR
jgi:hypothetical protein